MKKAIWFLSIYRTVAEHYFRECGVYLVQPFRGKRSGNCSKEVSTIRIGDYVHINVFSLSCLHKLVNFRLRDHVQGVDNNPLLIFPEGTCINNQYSVMFKKV